MTKLAEVASSSSINRTDILHDSVKESGSRNIFSPFAIGLYTIMIIVLSIGVMAYSGYRAGVQLRDVKAATAVAEEIQLQYSLAVQDMDIGQTGVAVQRLEYIVQVIPDYPGAAEMLARAREFGPGEAVLPVSPIEVTLSAEEHLSAEENYVLLSEAYRRGAWSVAVSRAAVLRAIDAQHRSASVDSMLFVSLRNRGIERIDSGVLKLGMADLEHAEQIITLDDVALQRRRWATLYLDGMTFWELNWQLAIDNLSILHQIAPNFLDTRSLLREAYVAYGEALLLTADSCLAGDQFMAALIIAVDMQTEQQMAAAAEACALSDNTS